MRTGTIHFYVPVFVGARGGAIGWGTALQAGRSRVRFLMISLEFFIDIILPAMLWPWGTLNLQQKWVPAIFPGGKGGRCIRLTTCHLHVLIILKSGSLNLLEPSGPVQACNGIALLLLFTSICYYFQPIFLICGISTCMSAPYDFYVNKWAFTIPCHYRPFWHCSF